MDKEIKLEQFIGIFPNAITDDLCYDFVRVFNSISEHGLTMSSMQDSANSTIRKDEVLYVPSGLSIMHDCFHANLTTPLWQNIENCLNSYLAKHDIDEILRSSGFKIHRVQPAGGYHVWHHEHYFDFPYRTLAWHLTIEAPESGGETEFLYQSMRVKPRVGQLLIWPAAFTHKHRGNPPLKGQKTYITGWFDCTPSPQQQQQQQQ